MDSSAQRGQWRFPLWTEVVLQRIEDVAGEASAIYTSLQEPVILATLAALRPKEISIWLPLLEDASIF